MNTGAVVDGQAGVGRARDCLRQINAPVPKFERFWSESDIQCRRMLLRIAAANENMDSYAWGALPQSVRDAVIARSRSLRDWLLRVLPA